MTGQEFQGLVTDGRLPAAVGQKLAAALRRLDGRRVVVTLKEMKRRRSLSQNRYYFGVVVPALTDLFREAGNDFDDKDTHEYLKEHVGKLSRVVVLPDGEVKRLIGSTRRLNTKEMSDYLEKCLAFAAEHGAAIPLPGELTG